MSHPPSPGTEFLSPEFVARVPHLALRARLVVEGFISGLHKSPFYGFNVEFAEHREYTPGDDYRHIDWKSYARTEKFYIKLFEEETNLRVYLLVDASASMEFREHGTVTKMAYAQSLAASIGYLALRQKDAVGLATFQDDLTSFLAPSSRMSVLHDLVQHLEAIRPSQITGFRQAFRAIADRLSRRGLVILISDLWSDPQEVLAVCAHLRHLKHDVLVLQVLDPVERDLNLRGERTFVDAETGQPLPVSPTELRSAYQTAFETHQRYLRAGFADHGIDYALLTTDEPYHVALSRYLSRRHHAALR